MAALEQYDILLTQVLRSAEGATDLAWAREQLSFCIVLSLNNAYYQVREWEAKAFYDYLNGPEAAAVFEKYGFILLH